MALLVTVFSGQVLVRRATGEEQVIGPKSGRAVGVVVEYNRDRGVIAVKVENVAAGTEDLKGKTVEFRCRWKKNDDGKWAPDPACLKLLAQFLTGDRVEVGFTREEGYRVDTVEAVKKVPAKGRLVGEVVGRRRGILRVKVTQTQAGAETLKGLTIIISAEWKKIDGRWQPDPEDAERLARAKVGDRVEVGYYRNEHYRASSVEVQENGDK